jgi:cytochrome c
MKMRRLLVLLALGSLPMQAICEEDAQLKRGRLLFMQCRACHETTPSDAQKVGPNLHGIFGRAAASSPGYAFSEALSKSGIVWTAETLDRWIERPSALVPGTTMVFAGIASSADRAALVKFLESATASNQATAER